MNFFLRLVTGAFYIAVLLLFALLRHINILFFDLLIVIFAVLGSIEMSRAVGDRADKLQKWIAGIFSVLLIVCYALSDSLFRALQESGVFEYNYAPHLTFVVFVAEMAILFSLLVFRHEKTSMESMGYTFLLALYPAVFLLVLSACNHMPMYSEIGIVFIFAICPFADCFAYLFGMLFGKKLPAKMAPHVSPHKTLIGGFGGILGGAVGAAATFYVYYGLLYPGEVPLTALNVIFFVALGILTAAFSQVGDLVESAIKRKFGIKDMGNILPGHGGILDRIDSALFACLIVCFVIVIRIMTTG